MLPTLKKLQELAGSEPGSFVEFDCTSQKLTWAIRKGAKIDSRIRKLRSADHRTDSQRSVAYCETKERVTVEKISIEDRLHMAEELLAGIRRDMAKLT